MMKSTAAARSVIRKVAATATSRPVVVATTAVIGRASFSTAAQQHVTG